MQKKLLLGLLALLLLAGGVVYYLSQPSPPISEEDRADYLQDRASKLALIAPNSPDLAALETFVDVLEWSDTQPDPANPLEEVATSESQSAMLFSDQVAAFLADSTHQMHQKTLLRTLRIWEVNHRSFLSTISQNPALAPYEEMSKFLSVISHIGIKAVHAIANETRLPEAEHAYYQEMLEIAERPVLGAELAVVEAIRTLIAQATPL